MTPEIVPTAFRTKLKTLQSDVPGRPYDDIVPIAEAELGPLAESFSSFSEEHIGAASIGQAHRATTVDGGNSVVVKVMYLDAEVNFKADFACIEGMINLGIYMEALDGDSMKGFFKEMQQQFMAELDFRKEVANLNEIRGSTGAAYEGRVVLPEPMMALSSQHVITMTYLEGPKLEDQLLRRLKSLGIQSKEKLRSMMQTTEEVDNGGKAMVTWNGESSAAGFGHAVADTFAAKAGYYVMSALGPGLAFRLLRNGEWLYSSASSAARSGVNIAGWLAGYGNGLIPAPDPR